MAKVIPPNMKYLVAGSIFKFLCSMANVMQMVIENLLLQMILSLGILSLSKEIVTLSLINLAMQKPRLTSFF